MTDSDTGTLSQEEIAAQFVLPERKAKVNQLLAVLEEDHPKEKKPSDKKLKSPPQGYRGGMEGGGRGTPPRAPPSAGFSAQAGGEEQYCICRSSNCSTFMICCDNCNEWYHGDCIGVTHEDAKHIKSFFCDICRDKDPTLQIKYEKKKSKDPDKPEKSHHHHHKKHDKHDKHDKHHHKEHKEKKKGVKFQEDKSSRGKSSRRCGDCAACKKREDCSTCDFCKDMKKYGGPNRIRQKCRLRQCLNYGLLTNKKLFESGNGASRLRTDSNGDSDYDPFNDSTENISYEPPVKNQRRSESEQRSPARKKSKGTKEKKKTTKKKQKQKQRKVRQGSGQGEKRKRSELATDDIRLEMEEDVPRQCYGPGCVEPAREGSKYCSDECGMKLATNRIFEILPQRIQQWQQSPCLAEENNKLSLEKIRRQQLQARQKLVELDLKHQELDALIERAKHATISKEQDNTDDQEESDSVYCVTCGHEVGQRTALKHMEKCFAKYESQTSFGSIYKTRIEGNSMFCDYFHPVQQTYCKRLKVLCPEHSKEQKVAADEVCGCPLVANVFEDTGEFCRMAKRKCNKHYCWEKLRRAEIDMERVRQWMLLDDLFEQERNIRLAMANRAGVLGLVLHQTIDHDPLNPIKNTIKIT